MPSYNVVSALVSEVIRNSPDMPASYRDADALTQRRVERQAEAENTTPEKLWEVIRTQHGEDKHRANGEGFDAEAIAKAARR